MVIKIHDKGRRPAKVYLREWLDYRGLTAERLADRLEVSKGQISKLINGKQRYNQDWLEMIAFALDCDVPDLYRPPEAPTANELLSRMTPEAKETALKLLVDLANYRTGTSG
jgi:transcriptional regulator with XRE-family HTH domain